MKKIVLAIVLICALLIPCLNVGATAQQIILNGTALDIPAEMGRIQERDDRTFVSVQFICEYFNCKVSYNETQQSATLTDQENTSYFLMLDSSELYKLPLLTAPAFFNMDTKAFVDETDGQMYVPLRFLAEAMNYTVGWDEEAETVSITSAAK